MTIDEKIAVDRWSFAGDGFKARLRARLIVWQYGHVYRYGRWTMPEEMTEQEWDRRINGFKFRVLEKLNRLLI